MPVLAVRGNIKKTDMLPHERVTSIKNKRYGIFLALLDAFDDGCRLVDEYNALLHDYNGVVMYQAESQFIRKIGISPGITITDLALYFGKSQSACSQLMRRMSKKGWLYQRRNEENWREFQLFLTEDGKMIFACHKQFEDACYFRTAQMLDTFTDVQLQTYIDIQKEMNAAFLQDVEESRCLQVNKEPRQKVASRGDMVK